MKFSEHRQVRVQLGMLSRDGAVCLRGSTSWSVRPWETVQEITILPRKFTDTKTFHHSLTPFLNKYLSTKNMSRNNTIKYTNYEKRKKIDAVWSIEGDPDPKERDSLVPWSEFIPASKFSCSKGWILVRIIWIWPQSNELTRGATEIAQPFRSVLRIRIRDPVPFWPLDPGSGISFFRIPDPKSIFLRA